MMWEAEGEDGGGRGRTLGCVAVPNQLTQTRVRTGLKPKQQPVEEKKKSEKFREPDSKQVDKLLQVLLFVLPKLGKEPVGQNNSERHTIYTPTQRKGKISTKPVLKGLPYWFTLIWLHSSPVSIKFGCVKKRR